MKVSITVKKEFKFTPHLNMHLEWYNYFYRNLASLPYFKCEHPTYHYPPRLCDACFSKHHLELSTPDGDHHVSLEAPPEVISSLKSLFDDHCHVRSL